jgi:hypothetical protein
MMAAPGNDIGRQSADRVAALPEKPKRLALNRFEQRLIGQTGERCSTHLAGHGCVCLAGFRRG